MIKISKKRFILIIVLAVAIAVACCGGAAFAVLKIQDAKLVSASEYSQYKKGKNLYAKLYTMQSQISSEYLYDYDESEMEDAMLKAYMNALGDQYSAYLTTSESETWDAKHEGTFYGVGVASQNDGSNHPKIVEVYEDTPAESAGLKAGDIITKVDGKTYSDYSEYMAALRGEAGTEVKVTYTRNGKENTVTMTRAEIKSGTVSSQILDGNIGYIRIISFGSDTASEFETELTYMENQKVKGLIIDLRNNTGGYTSSAYEIADLLLPECTVGVNVDKSGDKSYTNSKAGKTSLNYVVLVNGYTASASEILAAAIQDNGGGKLIGTKTYGKGVAQREYKFKDGSAFKFTINEFLTPNGNKINGVGITPDIVVESTDSQLQTAINELSK